jgi:hypothetical protein
MILSAFIVVLIVIGLMALLKVTKKAVNYINEPIESSIGDYEDDF